jgi:hypothetical protein
MKSPPQPTDRKAVDALQSERSRMQAEVGNVIAGAHRTLAQSRALLAEVDAFLAREKTPPSTPRALIAKATVARPTSRPITRPTSRPITRPTSRPTIPPGSRPAR